jgi:hypothetical protein
MSKSWYFIELLPQFTTKTFIASPSITEYNVSGGRPGPFDALREDSRIVKLSARRHESQGAGKSGEPVVALDDSAADD